jgi:methyl-accepting chemotaxis protein
METLLKKSRFRIIIYPNFQMTLILLNVLLAIFTFAINMMEASRAFSRFNELGQTIKLAPDHAFFKLIELQAGNLYSYMILSFLISIGISCLVTALLSHRLAGPIVRLRSYFQDIASSGKVSSELHFREGDFFSDLPENVNNALMSLRKETPSSPDSP